MCPIIIIIIAGTEYCDLFVGGGCHKESQLYTRDKWHVVTSVEGCFINVSQIPRGRRFQEVICKVGERIALQ